MRCRGKRRCCSSITPTSSLLASTPNFTRNRAPYSLPFHQYRFQIIPKLTPKNTVSAPTELPQTPIPSLPHSPHIPLKLRLRLEPQSLQTETNSAPAAQASMPSNCPGTLTLGRETRMSRGMPRARSQGERSEMRVWWVVGCGGWWERNSVWLQRARWVAARERRRVLRILGESSGWGGEERK